MSIKHFRSDARRHRIYVAVGTERTLLGSLAAEAGFTLQLDVEPNATHFNSFNRMLLASSSSIVHYRQLRFTMLDFRNRASWIPVVAGHAFDSRLTTLTSFRWWQNVLEQRANGLSTWDRINRNDVGYGDIDYLYEFSGQA